METGWVSGAAGEERDRCSALGAARQPSWNGTSVPLKVTADRCRAWGKQFNERSESLLNRTQYPSDVIALVVLWRLRYKLSLRDHWLKVCAVADAARLG